MAVCIKFPNKASPAFHLHPVPVGEAAEAELVQTVRGTQGASVLAHVLQELDRDYCGFPPELRSRRPWSTSRGNLLQIRTVSWHFSSSLLTLGHGPSICFTLAVPASETCQMEPGWLWCIAEPPLGDLGTTRGRAATERAASINKLRAEIGDSHRR